MLAGRNPSFLTRAARSIVTPTSSSGLFLQSTRIPLLILVLAGPALLPIQSAWADDGKSEGGDGGVSDHNGGSDDRGGSEDSGSSDHGGGDSLQGNDDSSGGRSGRATDSRNDKDSSLASRLSGKIASLQEIEILAARMVPGEIVDIRLRRENSGVVYRLKIMQKNDRLVIVRIDARTRKRLRNSVP
jgi:hypothetical protein